MLSKFETKSQRVKGISFHPNRPWVLASLHNGEIQLWDYRIGTLIEKFCEHEGPVRGIAFHSNQPLFVSGGDDYKIMGWNYKTKKRLFLLTGHLDYIRNVSFHHELPWVLSSSDDQTARIWNYLSRQQIAILTGHSHYVMCAQFHPSKELIVTCSLDQTIRLWDYTNLKLKYTSSGSMNKNTSEQRYITNEVELKTTLEGHDRGVNWVAFHPTVNFIASGADDRKIKLWKYNESTGKGWEHDSLYGHTNNVSCVVFYEKLDLIISNAEDKTIRVWDLNRRICVDTFRKDNDRYWILTVHPSLNYIAAGSDTGLTVFTLQSERVPAVISANMNDLFYVHRKQLIHRDAKSGRELIIKSIDYAPTASSMVYHKPSNIYYNVFNNSAHNIVVQFKDKEKGHYKYYLITIDNNIERNREKADMNFKYAVASVFVAKDKLAVLSAAKEVAVTDFHGNSRPLPNLPSIDMIYQGYLGKVVLRSDCTAILYDTVTRKIVNQFEYTDIHRLKHIVWNSRFTYGALLCKKTIYIVNKSFNVIGTIQEKFNVTSAAWNVDDVLIYTTQNHLKYSLLNGDFGILQCLEYPIYLIQVKDSQAITIDRDARIETLTFRKEDYLFKLALFLKDIKRVKTLITNQQLLGNSLIAYLYKKNYSAIALHLVTDTRARFSLALDSGNLEVAFQTCHEQLKNRECYGLLGEEALRQGNHQITEIAYQQTRSFDKLSFLYLITGNMARYEKMIQIAQKRGDIMARFNNALLLGDVQERIRVLAEAGLIHLAYATAVTHNVQDMVEPLKESLKDDLPIINQKEKAQALVPLKPIITDPKSTNIALCNWPHNQLQDEEILLARDAQTVENEGEEIGNQQELEMNLDVNVSPNEIEAPFSAGKDFDEPVEGNWGVDDILDIPDVEIPATTGAQETFSALADSAPGKDPIFERAKTSQLSGELVACGEFENAAGLLKKQIGLVDVDKILKVFQKINVSSQVKISGFQFSNPVNILMSEDGKRPYTMVTMAQLTGMLREAYRTMTKGKFSEASDSFKEILLHIPLLVLHNPGEEQDVHSLIRICYNYILATKCELSKKNAQADPVRLLELSAYMSCCVLQPVHRILTLNAAMIQAYKSQDFIYAAYFAKKLIQLAQVNPTATKPEVVDKAKKVYGACEQKGTNEHTIDFDQNWLNDDDSLLKICAKTLKIIKGTDIRRDAFVKASYSPQFDGQVDEISGVCKIGVECLGLKLY